MTPRNSYQANLTSSMRERVTLQLAVVAFLVICAFLVACSSSDSPYLNTLTKLQNIRTVMPHLCDFSNAGSMAFPQTGSQLAEIMYDEFGFERSSSSELAKQPFVDGWGQEMRVTGDTTAYEIRSAGPDKTFDTDDDIYITGTSQGERIVDGVKNRNQMAGQRSY